MSSDYVVDQIVITENDIKNIKLWYLSFVPLVVATILFVICFLFEYLILYVFLLLIFALFVVVFQYTTKKITLKDGFTLVQAKNFYKACKKAKITFDGSLNGNEAKVFKLAKKYDYSKDLTKEQVLTLFEIGKKLMDI